MASTTKFSSGLNKWVETDKPARLDFVSDNQILDDNALWKEHYDKNSEVKNAGGISDYVNSKMVVPSGMIAPFAGATAPKGWLLCQGQAVDRVTYNSLFAVIGTLYGSGNGTTTFNVPNMTGRFPMGYDSSWRIGTCGGVATEKIDSKYFPYETMVFADTAKSHSVTNSNKWTTGLWRNNGEGVGSMPISATTAPYGSTFSKMPPFLSLMYIIKT